MIRFASVLSIVLLLLVSFALYNGVYLVKGQERELKELDAAVAGEAEAIRVLKAEWSSLNRPERLQAMARRHLKLGPTGASQIVMLANLPERGETLPDGTTRTIDAADLPERPVDPATEAADGVTPKPKASPKMVPKSGSASGQGSVTP
jgi:hypothetical protein